ncbi:MAG: isopentenyl-diphosphate Delta-isomerase [Bacteroidetes bacterium]|nr:isopentenyl-diphosphate Delta-isomerase [Bacteroidota bacterium]
MQHDKVILVDEQDRELGQMEKLEAHQKGLLHRAISVFIFNSHRELLLQRRAAGKYHSAGLWTNTCCSHPWPGESTKEAAGRRLYEEMGLHAELQFNTSFIYKTVFDNGLTEHELDHIFTGNSNDTPLPDPMEVAEYKWSSLADIRRDMQMYPEEYTSWFKIIMDSHFK